MTCTPIVEKPEHPKSNKVTDFYHPNDEGGLMWNDPEIGVEWPFIFGPSRERMQHGAAGDPRCKD